MNNEEILEVATSAGKVLLQSGAEIYRVEETITHILESYHIEDGNAYVLPNGIFVSFTKDQQSYNKILRVKENQLHLHRINEINALSRNAKKEVTPPALAMKHIHEISKSTIYSPMGKTFASGGIAFFFTVFFNGTLIESICAFFIGILIQIVSTLFEKKKINNLVKILCVSILLTLSALCFVYLGIAENKDSIITGSLMLLVPGLAITNAIRDSINGDLLSGITRGIEAILIAIMIALGSGISMNLWNQLLGGIF